MVQSFSKGWQGDRNFLREHGGKFFLEIRNLFLVCVCSICNYLSCMIMYFFIPLWFMQCFNCCSRHASDKVYML